MLNRITTTKSWMVASLLAATSVFAQDSNSAPAPTKCRPQKSYEQGHELTASQMMAAYNAPARIDVRGAWDFYATGTFVYWQPLQDNMELAVASTTRASLTSAAVNGSAGNPGNIINMDFDYKPGFKVGLGMNFDYDNWDGYAEYTWFHGTNTQSSNASSTGALFAFVGHPSIVGTNGYNTGSENWKLKMDFADVNLGRSYYVGTKLSFRPFMGARGAWIRQRANYTFVNDGTLGFGTAGTLTSLNKSVSWGVGPSVGMSSNWMFGYGLRATGVVNADLLFTRYNTSIFELFTGNNLTFNTNQHHANTLRPHANLEMGFGWGSYFDNNNWHFDLLATYGFQVFWNQNMFRHYTDDVRLSNSNMPNGDLYVQGLNLSARLDF